VVAIERLSAEGDAANVRLDRKQIIPSRPDPYVVNTEVIARLLRADWLVTSAV
jgi:hypothetical protein